MFNPLTALHRADVFSASPKTTVSTPPLKFSAWPSRLERDEVHFRHAVTASNLYKNGVWIPLSVPPPLRYKEDVLTPVEVLVNRHMADRPKKALNLIQESQHKVGANPVYSQVTSIFTYPIPQLPQILRHYFPEGTTIYNFAGSLGEEAVGFALSLVDNFSHSQYFETVDDPIALAKKYPFYVTDYSPPDGFERVKQGVIGLKPDKMSRSPIANSPLFLPNHPLTHYLDASFDEALQSEYSKQLQETLFKLNPEARELIQSMVHFDPTPTDIVSTLERWTEPDNPEKPEFTRKPQVVMFRLAAYQLDRTLVDVKHKINVPLLTAEELKGDSVPRVQDYKNTTRLVHALAKLAPGSLVITSSSILEKPFHTLLMNHGFKPLINSIASPWESHSEARPQVFVKED